MKKILLTSFILSFLSLTSALAQRKVLVEQFTNSGCPPCAGNTPVVADYVNDNPDEVLMLAYHAPFPYLDSMYFENSFQSDQRISFYNVFSVPTSRVDGNYFSGNLVPVIATTITNRAAVAPRYAITFTTSNITDETLHVNVHFESIDVANQDESLQAMVVVAEKNVLKSSYAASPGNNTETQYPWVVRKMLPDEDGTSLVNTALNGSDDVSLSWTEDNFKNLSEMRVIAFVQNTVTKEIYQAEISTPQTATGTNDFSANSTTLFTLFPSITRNGFTVKINNLQNDMQLKMIDVTGKVIYSSKVEATDLSIATAEFPTGVYIIHVSNSDRVETKRLILTK